MLVILPAFPGGRDLAAGECGRPDHWVATVTTDSTTTATLIWGLVTREGTVHAEITVDIETCVPDKSRIRTDVRVKEGRLVKSGELWGGTIDYWVPEEWQGQPIARGTWDPVEHRWLERTCLLDTENDAGPILQPALAYGVLALLGPGGPDYEVREQRGGKVFVFRHHAKPGSVTWGPDGSVHRETEITVLVDGETAGVGTAVLDGRVDPGTGFLLDGTITTDMEISTGMTTRLETHQVKRFRAQPSGGSLATPLQ